MGSPNLPQERDDRKLLEGILAELKALRRLLDEFAGAFLNAKFKFGKPTDRWGGR